MLAAPQGCARKSEPGVCNGGRHCKCHPQRAAVPDLAYLYRTLAV